MIGNDIVDLSLAAIQSNWQRRGFLEKQFTKKRTRLHFKCVQFFCASMVVLEHERSGL